MSKNETQNHIRVERDQTVCAVIKIKLLWVKEQTLRERERVRPTSHLYNLPDHQQVCYLSLLQIFIGRECGGPARVALWSNLLQLERELGMPRSCQGKCPGLLLSLVLSAGVCVFMRTYHQLRVYWFNNPCTCPPPLNTFVCTAESERVEPERELELLRAKALASNLLWLLSADLFAHFDCFSWPCFDELLHPISAPLMWAWLGNSRSWGFWFELERVFRSRTAILTYQSWEQRTWLPSANVSRLPSKRKLFGPLK